MSDGKSELANCRFCGAKPGQKVGPPAMARCITPLCEGTKLAAEKLDDWNARNRSSASAAPEREPVAFTNQAQLDYLRKYADIPMAMWGKRDEKYCGIPLYAVPPSPAMKAVEEELEQLKLGIASVAFALGWTDIKGVSLEQFAHDTRAQLASARKALEEIEGEAERYAEMYPQSSDGRNTFIIFGNMVRSKRRALSDNSAGTKS